MDDRPTAKNSIEFVLSTKLKNLLFSIATPRLRGKIISPYFHSKTLEEVMEPIGEKTNSQANSLR
jgi:hypothetical protein